MTGSEAVDSLISELREPYLRENHLLCCRAADAIEGYREAVQNLEEERRELKSEVEVYRNAARLYGIDARTMLTLAKSQIKTCADNIRITEKMQEFLSVFDVVPADLTAQELPALLSEGGSRYGETVNCALMVLVNYLKVRDDINEWRKNHL